jgi:ribosomal-protein-serine acetyltransferase
MIITIQPQLYLRLIAREDAFVIYYTIDQQRDYLGQWLPFVANTKELRDTEDFIKTVLQQPIHSRESIFTIWYDGTFAGIVGFKDTDRLNSKTEIGYWLSEPFQKKGIMTLCVKELCEHAFEKLGLNRVQIKCAVGNISSQKIPERLGFVIEGIERAGERYDETLFLDLKVYSKLKSDR